MKTVTANGANMPVLGFGTFRIPGEQVLRILPQAIKTGFRHIDTAQAYRNEAQVGEAIQVSGVPRDEIFLTTKVWVDNYKHADFIASVDESLKKLRTDHVDLLLLHWPNNSVPLAEQIGALNEVREAGRVKNIGVSNFTTALMAKSVELSDAPIATNQIEYHPYLDQTKVLDAAHATGMSITAYFAMADGKVPNEPLLKDIGSRHGKTAAQVVLRWLIQQKDVVTLSKTATESRLSENFDIFDFELSADEMAAIQKLARPNGRIVSPGGLAPDWDKAA